MYSKCKTQVFDGRNNIVWVIKQYCFAFQTQVFDESNNIVWELKYHLYSQFNENEYGLWNVNVKWIWYFSLEYPIFQKCELGRKWVLAELVKDLT